MRKLDKAGNRRLDIYRKLRLQKNESAALIYNLESYAGKEAYTGKPLFMETAATLLSLEPLPPRRLCSQGLLQRSGPADTPSRL